MDPAQAIEAAAMSPVREADMAAAQGDSDIQSFYKGCVLFVTGGSGFMGKQLLEKLFRSCEISKVYLLLRAKKGKDTADRLKQMLQDPVFDRVRSLKPDFAQALAVIEGDVSAERLAISDQDWETLVQEVNVIYHMAATTRFDESLHVATLINVRGTREALLLGKACKNLKSFVHVSTAYTNATSSLVEQRIPEQFRPSPVPPEALISMAEKMDPDRLESLTPPLIRDWPNTYTFAKAAAEELIREMSCGMPICIVRPGIVQAAYREPSPGWLDASCMFGATGLMMGAGLGVLHTMISKYHTKLGVVPCDFVNNAIIAAGREASRAGGHVAIYTLSSVARRPLNQGYLLDVMRKNRMSLMSPKTVYYPYGVESSSHLLFFVLTWLMHLIPAYFVDAVLLLLGRETRAVKTYKKVYKMQNALSHFSMNSWYFDDKNLETLYKSLSKTDKIIFNFDIPCIDWDEYIKIWCIGLRKYIIKDGLTGTDKANKRFIYLRILHYILSSLYFYLIWKFVCGVYFVATSLFFFAKSSLST